MGTKAARFSKLSASNWGSSVRLYFQADGQDTIQKLCKDPGRDWYMDVTLHTTTTPSDRKPIDITGAPYVIGELPELPDVTVNIGFPSAILIDELFTGPNEAVEELRSR